MSGTASAQMTPAEVRAILGGPINLEEAALFAATRTSYKHLCEGEPWAEFHASIINRLNYGSLTDPEKELFVGFYGMQVRSNTKLFESFDVVARRFFCDGLDKTVTSMAANFADKHPDIFTETNAPDEKKTVEENFEGSMFLKPSWDYAKPTENRTSADAELVERRKQGEIGSSETSEENAEQGSDPASSSETKMDQALTDEELARVSVQMPGAATRRTTAPGFVSRADEDLVQAEAEQEGFFSALSDSFTSGDNIAYQFLAAIDRKIRSGPVDENWKGDVIDDWMKINQIDPYDQWRYKATGNLQEAEMLRVQQGYSERSEDRIVSRSGFGIFIASIFSKFIDPLAFIPTFLIISVFIRASVVKIVIIGVIVGPLLLLVFAALGPAEISPSRIAAASIVGIVHALIAISIMSRRRQIALAAAGV